MTKKTQRLHNIAKLPLALAIAASMSTPASAFQFDYGNLEASLDTTLTAGASWRIEDRDPGLLGFGNGGEGSTTSSDDGNWNFDKGDTYSKIIKGTSDFIVYYEDYGFFARARYWYDFELKDEDRAVDDVGQQRSLNDKARANASGGEFLDAYIWGDYYVGEVPVNLRLGYQVVSWGESAFIFNGVNVINPIDLGAIRAPGAEVKDALLPIPMVYGSFGLTEDITLEAFLQLRWEPTKIDDCGTFFSTNDYVADGCGPVEAAGGIPEFQNPVEFDRLADKDARDTDQFGLALRWFAADLNETEFGFYFVQYHSRFPIVSGVTSTAIGANDGQYFVEYPEDIRMYGLSFNTTAFGGWSVGGELSHKTDVPVQINSPDLLLGANLDPISPVFQERVPDFDGDGDVDVLDAIASGFNGIEQPGYEAFDVTQLSLIGIKFWDQVFGASRLTLVTELGMTWVHDIEDSGLRFGRFDQVGLGETDTGTADCESSLPTTPDCTDTDGYVTDFSAGYRIRASLLYNDVFAGVNVTPTLSFFHDVEGYAPGPGGNFIEDRIRVGLSLRAEYLNQYSATLAYQMNSGAEPYNPTSDRDNVALSVSYSF